MATDAEIGAFIRENWSEIGAAIHDGAEWAASDGHEVPEERCAGGCDQCDDFELAAEWFELLAELKGLVGKDWEK